MIGFLVPDFICYQKFHTVGETKQLSFEGIFHLQAEHPSFYLNYAHCLHNICESFIDVTQQNPKTGNTFLHYACENRKEKLLKYNINFAELDIIYKPK